jgi:RHS repeat-associated protein
VSREEYFPYGETSFGSFRRKRYRFTGKERDEESGLDYHSARYWAAGVVRWITPDPAGRVEGPNLYVYARCNPVARTDPGGAQSGTPKKEKPPILPIPKPPNTNTVVRKASPSDYFEPEKIGFKPTDPNSKLSLSEHFLNEGRGTLGRPQASPFISVSEKLLGADTITEGNPNRYWISIDKTREAGTGYIPHEEARATMADAAAKDPTLAERVKMWLKAQPNEQESAFRGRIPPEAVESGATRSLKGGSVLLTYYALMKSAQRIDTSIDESRRAGSAGPVIKQVAKEAGGWGGAQLGAMAGAELGGLVGIETGPFAVVTGLAGSMIGGVLGYLGVEVSIDAPEDLRSIADEMSRQTEDFCRQVGPAL